LNNSAHPEIVERKIYLTSSVGRPVPVLAEHAVYFILALLYRARLLEEQQRSHVWNTP
jgi:phosphoglycerate dehydrogenase-like enzyme